jgi:hypothetical protein
MGESIVAHVATNSGPSVEQVGKALGAKAKGLALSIIRLIEAKKPRTTGEMRDTRYHAAGAGTEAAPARKARALPYAGGAIASGDGDYS